MTGAILNADLAGSIADSKLSQITTASKVHGSSITGLASIPAGAGLIPTANLPTLNPHGVEVFTSSGTFTAPTDITKVYLSMIGGGGGGGGATNAGDGAGGGGSGAWVVNRPYTVVPGNDYTVTIPAAAAGGADQNSDGATGGTVVFDALSIVGGSGGLRKAIGTGGAGGAASLNASGATPGVGAMAGGNGGDKSTSTGGAGGSSPFGMGAAGASSGTVAAGGANTGAGGAGAVGDGSGDKPGGAGGTGIVIVIY